MSVSSYGSGQGQRSYYPKVSRQSSSSSQHGDSRPSSFTSTTSTVTPYQWNDTFDPLDYEDFVVEHSAANERDPLKLLLSFPADDLHICFLPRPSRTLHPVIPPEPLEALNSRVRDCVRNFTSPWLMVQRRYQHLSTNSWARQPTAARLGTLKTLPRQEFELDGDGCDNGDDFESNRSSTVSSRTSTLTSETPRGSWASFDLRQTASDALLPSLLDRMAPEAVDLANKNRRMELKQENLFSLYPLQDEEDMIERRPLPEPPAENSGHRLLVKCTQLKLDLEIEPIYASMALYDVKEKKKISENFYFDLNDDAIKRMMDTHVPYQDYSTLSRSCIFQVTYPSTDLFLVVKLEKVLQGDITDCAEPYIKDDKNREKVRANAVACCERLGKYRMPFAWTGIHLHSILHGASTQERDRNSSFMDKDHSLSESSGANSLDRKSSTSSFEQFRRRAAAEGGGSWSRRGSLERRSNYESKRNSWSAEDAAFASSLDSFRPVTLTVSSFFKQEGDRLRDEDLFKYLQELRKSSGALKRLKCIPGTLKLEVSPCPEEVRYCLTAEMARLHPFPDEKMRPTKELVEFPPKDVFVPHFSYRNLYYVYPKSLNFTNRPGSARNIAVKIQFMCGEQEQHAMPVIFGRSSCPEFTTEALTAVTYHNKCPDFYDEVKVKLPANLKDCHHLLFTFYHVSCQKKAEQNAAVETVVGYSWLPVLKDGSLQVGEFILPVMLDPPPPNYLYIGPEVMLPGTRWVDNHKGIFNILIEANTSVHTLDRCLDRFLDNCAAVEEHVINPRIGEANMESELRQSILDLVNAKTEPLVKFLPLILDKLLSLMTKPPVLAGQQLNIGPSCFESLAMIVRSLSDSLDHLNDQHGRNSLLATYIHYVACVPQEQLSSFAQQPQQPRPMSLPPQRKHSRSTSQPDVHATLSEAATADAEVSAYFPRGVDRTCSLRMGSEPAASRYLHKKLIHEEIAFHWRMCSATVRDVVFSNSWFFFELMIKSAVEHLASTQQLEAPRKHRFPEQFLDDVSQLVAMVTAEIIQRQQREGIETACILNLQLAFFLHDILSVMDRGYVFSLIRSYCRQLTEEKSQHSLSAHNYMSLKLDFLRIVSSHEHFVALNLPQASGPYPSSSPPSPSPSVSSSASQSSFVSTLVGTSAGSHFAELTPEFCQKHYLVGLILSEISAVLENQNQTLHVRGANLMRNLLSSHDWDPRYADPSCKARVASLYLPMVGVLLDRLHYLHDWSSEAKGRPPVERNIDDDVFVSTGLRGTTGNANTFPRRATISSETTRHLLVCFLWVIRHVDEASLRLWWCEMTPQRLQRLLELLFISVSCFEYRGKRDIRASLLQGQGRSSDVKAQLENLIRGQGSARSEMMQRRRGNQSGSGHGSGVVGNSQFYTGLGAPAPQTERNPSPSPHLGYSERPGLRWRKDLTARRPGLDAQDKSRLEVEMDAHIEGNLATQANLAILDSLETIVQVLSQQDSLQGLLPVVLRVLLHILGCCQSTALLQHAFATQRSLVYKFPGLLFDEETELCADLCLRLLRHCSSNISSIRSQASASLYLLMRQNFEIGNNFARVKMQVTMSLSSLVGTSQTFNEEALRRSLKTILVYAEEDTELQDTTFPEQVQDLVFNLHMILSDTVKMKEFQEDPEMLLDLMYRIAKGYQNSPDLRLTWLANMAQKHTERNNHAEAAMCLVHSAALVAEYLRMLEDRRHLPVGAVTFKKLSPNAIEESAVSDDVLSPDEEGFCSGKYFTENGLVGLLEQAASCFYTAGMYESMNEVYKILTPIAEAHRDFKKLINIHSKLHDAFSKIDQQQGKRVFGTYFRVGFYGSKFGDLDGEEFIYKEPTLTKLPEISHRLENFYVERFGAASVVMIKDSNPVDTAKLHPDKAYIQITYVEPYFDVSDLRERITLFEKNNNIKRFIYATPFTLDGRAHGDLHEQHKRKTILTTANHFPYVKTRIQVVERKQTVLTPIEVAIEDIQKKTNELASATTQDPPDPKILQMVLQGCIGTTVNQGPMEVANVFLANLNSGPSPPTQFQLKLRLCFKDFSKKCADALKKNKTLIGSDQHDYQRELERNYRRFTESLNPLICIGPAADTARQRRSRSKHSPMKENAAVE